HAGKPAPKPSKKGADDGEAAKAGAKSKEKNGPEGGKARSKKSVAEEGGKSTGKNLLTNGGFEDGIESGWKVVNNSGTAKMTVDKKATVEGKQSLKIAKTGGMPMDVLRCDLNDLPKGGKVRVSARVKTTNVKNAFFKFFVYDDAENSLVEDVD